MMSYFYSKENNAFYPESLKQDYENGDGWPEDAKEISDELYLALMVGQSSGKMIVSNKSGFPELAERTVNWQEVAETKRDSLLLVAKDITSDWRTELSLDLISEEDKSMLVKWMAYIQQVKSLDFDDVINEDYFNRIKWPQEPDDVA